MFMHFFKYLFLAVIISIPSVSLAQPADIPTHCTIQSDDNIVFRSMISLFEPLFAPEEFREKLKSQKANISGWQALRIAYKILCKSEEWKSGNLYDTGDCSRYINSVPGYANAVKIFSCCMGSVLGLFVLGVGGCIAPLLLKHVLLKKVCFGLGACTVGWSMYLISKLCVEYKIWVDAHRHGGHKLDADSERDAEEFFTWTGAMNRPKAVFYRIFKR